MDSGRARVGVRAEKGPIMWTLVALKGVADADSQS